MSNRPNLYPHLWGPHGWFFLDNIVFSYPEKPSTSDKILFRDFFNNIGKMLPCESCRKHYYKNLKKNPLTDRILSDKSKFIDWILQMHNYVRISNKQQPFTRQQMMDYYNNYNGNKPDATSYLLSLVVVFLISVIIYLILKDAVFKKRLKN
jgi:hypothetical protein